MSRRAWMRITRLEKAMCPPRGKEAFCVLFDEAIAWNERAWLARPDNLCDSCADSAAGPGELLKAFLKFLQTLAPSPEVFEEWHERFGKVVKL